MLEIKTNVTKSLTEIIHSVLSDSCPHRLHMLWRINPSKKEAFHFTYELPISGSRCNNCRDHIKHKTLDDLTVISFEDQHQHTATRPSSNIAAHITMPKDRGVRNDLAHSAVESSGEVDAGVASATPSIRRRG
jgi:hypothetical protein